MTCILITHFEAYCASMKDEVNGNRMSPMSKISMGEAQKLRPCNFALYAF
jgi:hypothetical protein